MKNQTNKGWAAPPMQRNSLHKPEVKQGFMVIALLAVVVIGGLIACAVSSYRWLCRSDFFQVTSIDVLGNQEVDKEKIIQLAGIEPHANLLALDLKTIAPRIEGYSWIEKVTLRKEWPSHLTIEVRERRPLALLNTPTGLYYVDSKGEPFAPLNGQNEIDFPVISGLESTLAFEGDTIQVNDSEKMQAALQFIGYAARGTSALPAQNISEIHLSEEQGVILFLADRPFPIFLGKELGKKSYNRLAKVLYWLYKKKEFQAVSYIRLDYLDNKILVGKDMDQETVGSMNRFPQERYDFSVPRESTLMGKLKERS